MAQARGAGRVDDLPESPQHRAWREARAAAAVRIEGFKALLWCATEEAMRFEGVAEPPSAWWFELSERLGAAFWLVGSARYCLHEWPEPSDARMDVDATDPNLGTAPPRRAVVRWDEQEAKAKGSER